METYLKRNACIAIFLMLLVQAWGIVKGNYILWMLILGIFIFTYMLHASKTTVLFIILFARTFFDSISKITSPKLMFGLSFMEIYTFGVMIFMVIYLLIYEDIELDSISKSTALILFSLILTGVYHRNVGGLIDVSSTWLYFIIAYSFFKHIFRDIPMQYSYNIIGLLSLYPCLNQLYSIIKGTGQMHMGHLRYAGTYIHPLVIGEYLLFAIPALLYLLRKEKRPTMKFFYISVIILYHVGILMAGYRTIWMATALFWFLYILFISKNKVFSILLVLLGITVLLSFSGKMIEANLSQLTTMAENWGSVISLHDHTHDRLLSKRVGMWKGIIKTYVDSGLTEKILGLGSNSIDKINLRKVNSALYAHNEYISALCETGILGLLCLFIWIFAINYKIRKCKFCSGKQHVQTIQSLIFSLLIIAICTMPFRHLNVINYMAVYIAILSQFTTSGLKLRKEY